ncbi:MAG: sensor histidine kinase [Chloroflexota bacterium]
MPLKDIMIRKRRWGRMSRRFWLSRLEEGLVTDGEAPAANTSPLGAILDIANSWLGVGRSAIFLFDVSGKRVTCLVSRGLSEAYLSDVRGGDQEAGRIWAELIARPLEIEDIRKEPEIGAVRGRLAAENIRSLLALPIRFGDQITGSIVLYRDEGHIWSRSETLLASLLAWCAALAIENWRLNGVAEKALLARDAFLSRASHEFRTPLTSILAYTQYLERHLAGKPNSDFELGYLRVVEAQALRMSRLVHDILDVKALEAEELCLKEEPLDMRELVREAVGEAEPITRDHALRVELPDESLEVIGDRRRLVRVIGNLISNAVRFSPGGEVLVRLATENGWARVEVVDSGIGVEENHQQLIFERFGQAETDPRSRGFGGLGIGLYASKAIVERHGGQIGVESREPAGTTLWFTLPLNACRVGS